MKKLINKILFGTSLPQEFLCLNLNEYKRPLSMLIKNSVSGEVVDVTDHHLLNGYKPLIISIDTNNVDEEILDKEKSISVSFKDHKNNELAELILNLREKIIVESSALLIFEGVFGKHHFNNNFQKMLRYIKYRLTSKRKSNIYLADNLYDQVKIGYSIPRKIYLVTVGSENRFNVFPSDLSGTLNGKTFILSLRTGEKQMSKLKQKESLWSQKCQRIHLKKYTKRGKII